MKTGVYHHIQNKYEEAQEEILHLREQVNQLILNNYALIERNQQLEAELRTMSDRNSRGVVQRSEWVGVWKL